MKTITGIKFCLLIFSVGLFFSCIGPQGPEGPEGPAGLNGLNGNANVKSAFIDVVPGDWLVDGNDNRYLYVNWNVDIITSDIASYGAVLVYFKSTTESNTWQMLPYTWPDGDYSELLRFWYAPGFLSLEIFNQNVPLAPGETYRFKVVAIADFYAKSQKAQEQILQNTTEMVNKGLY